MVVLLTAAMAGGPFSARAQDLECEHPGVDEDDADGDARETREPMRFPLGSSGVSPSMRDL